MQFLKDILAKRRQIIDLAKRDYRQENQGSYLGVVWNYVQPILLVGVLYAVFTLGFRGGEDSGTPFSLYLISGMVCWMYFTANLMSMAGVISGYSFLVRKVEFRLSILPVVKLVSSFLPHAILTILAISAAYAKGYPPSLYLFQLFYYFFCMAMLLLGIGWLTSSTSVFVKDVSNLVGVFVQFGFWLTPIIWRIEAMPEKIQWIIKLNPAYYLVSGYRDAILSQQFFWQREEETLIFWSITLAMFFLGAFVFKRLQPHFAEVI